MIDIENMEPRPQITQVSNAGDNAAALEHYFTKMRGAFENAVANSSDIRRYYRIGPDVLCLRFAGDLLVAALTAAVAHREIAATEPSFTIMCCDDQTIKAAMASDPWEQAAEMPAADDDGDMRIYYAPAIPIVNMFSRSERLGIYLVKQGETLPYWETSFPFRRIFHWRYRDSSLQMLHAGAVGTDKGGVILTGKGGVGKSTTALSCLNSPLDYVGDDYVAITSEPEPYVYNLFNTAKLVPENLGMFPHLVDKVSNAQELANEKALFFLNKHYPQKLSAGFPVKAIFLPRVTHERDTRLSPATGSEALLATLTTIVHLKGDSRLVLDKISKLVRSIPKYWLEVGTDLEQIPLVIKNFLDNCK